MSFVLDTCHHRRVMAAVDSKRRAADKNKNKNKSSGRGSSGRGSGSSSRRRPGTSRPMQAVVKREIVIRDKKDQQYAYVVRELGHCHFLLHCFRDDGSVMPRIGRLRGTMYRRQWVYRGALVLVSLRDFEYRRADIIHRYFDWEEEVLLSCGEVPSTSRGSLSIGDADDAAMKRELEKELELELERELDADRDIGVDFVEDSDCEIVSHSDCSDRDQDRDAYMDIYMDMDMDMGSDSDVDSDVDSI